MLLFSKARNDASEDFDLQVASKYGIENQLIFEQQKNTNQNKIALETKQFQTEIMKKTYELPEDIND